MVVIKGAPAVQKPVDKSVWGWLHWPLETTFLLIGFIFGLLFLLTTPPFQVADESRHFVRAYTVAENMLHRAGFIAPPEQLPASVVSAIRKTEHLRFDRTAKTTVGETLALLEDPLRPEKRASYPETALYAPLSYLPQLPALMGGRLLGLNAVLTLYVARFCALLFWLAVTCLALRTMPVAKHLLFFIALLPMTLFQAGSLSADCTTMAVSFLLIAYYLRLAHQPTPVRPRSVLIVSGLGALLTATKLVYLPLIGLHFLISPARFGSRRTYLWSFALSVLACVGTLFLLYYRVLMPFVGMGETLPTAGSSTGLTPYPQVNFLLADPLNIFRMLLTTWSRYGRGYLNEFVGVMGWTMTSLPSYLYILTAILIWLTASASTNCWLIRGHHKLLFVGISLLIIILIFVAISTDTSINSQPNLLLLGVQGRYFTPFALLIGLLAVNQSWLANRYRAYILGAVTPFVIFLLLNAYYVLLSQYYEL